MDSPETNHSRLKVTWKGKTLSVWEIPSGVSRIIGRGDEVHYQIKAGILSRRHCQVTDTGDALELIDLNSLNGTFVNNQRIDRAFLQNGDAIQLGPITITVETEYSSQDMTVTTKNVPAEDITNITMDEFLGDSEQDMQFCNPDEDSPSDWISQNPNTIEIEEQEMSDSESFLDLDAAEPISYSRPFREEDFPAGICLECDRPISSKEMSCHQGVFKENNIYCTPCFCDGVGDFPTIAGYRIVKKLGGGGMGDVYEAIQLSMERPVAFKIMKSLENASEAQVRRFFREARTGGKLTHPNIVGFIDAGHLESACYIAMEFIYGIDVKEMIEKKGPLPYFEAFRIAYYVATALEYANSRFNIVHRDVKPENILVDRDNIVKLTDFGLAKNLEEAGLSGITQSHTGLGTIFYMAPEQITNARFAGTHADIYSLGVTLYEMITGVVPFMSDQMMTLVEKIRNDDPVPVTELVSDVPDAAWHIIEKAMAKTTDERYSSPGAMKDAIHQLLVQVDPNYLT